MEMLEVRKHVQSPKNYKKPLPAGVGTPVVYSYNIGERLYQRGKKLLEEKQR